MDSNYDYIYAFEQGKSHTKLLMILFTYIVRDSRDIMIFTQFVSLN